MSLPTIVFDTSGINALAKGGAASEPIMKALLCGFDVWITAMSMDESIATRKPAVREVLLTCAQRLLGSGRCVWPPHEITTLLVSAHAKSPSTFDWRNVDVRARLYERAIIDRDYTNELCLETLEQMPDRGRPAGRRAVHPKRDRRRRRPRHQSRAAFRGQVRRLLPLRGDVEVVRFLVECKADGVKILNCSPYIRKWMARERTHLD